MAAVTTDFFLAYLLDDAYALARLEAGATVPPTELEFAAEVGSTVAIPSTVAEVDRMVTVEPPTGSPTVG